MVPGWFGRSVTEKIHPANSVVFDKALDTETSRTRIQIVRINRVRYLANPPYPAPESDTIRVFLINVGMDKQIDADLTLTQTEELIALLQAALAARRA